MRTVQVVAVEDLDSDDELAFGGELLLDERGAIEPEIEIGVLELLRPPERSDAGSASDEQDHPTSDYSSDQRGHGADERIHPVGGHNNDEQRHPASCPTGAFLLPERLLASPLRGRSEALHLIFVVALSGRPTVRIMRVSAEPFGRDRDGNPRVIAVRLDGTHDGVVVWHSPQEYARLWAGVDRASSSALGKPHDSGKRGSAG